MKLIDASRELIDTEPNQIAKTSEKTNVVNWENSDLKPVHEADPDDKKAN